MKCYFKYLPLLFVFLITACEEPNKSQFSSLNKLEYKITGGESGVSYHIIISGEGKATLTHYFKNRQYKISISLLKEQVDSLNDVFVQNRIFDLKDDYSNNSVVDVFHCEISYSSDRGIKNIVAELVDLPPELNNIISKLFDLSFLIETRADYGTLTTFWDTQQTIKKWTFQNVKLEMKVFYYNQLQDSTAIKKYFEEIRRNIGYDILYLDRDSLYSIVIETDYFHVHEVFPVKLWSNYFQEDISVVIDSGIVRPTNEWKQSGIFLNQNYIYVIDNAEDNGKALRLRLIAGKPVN